jgi:hypothetical protein
LRCGRSRSPADDRSPAYRANNLHLSSRRTIRPPTTRSLARGRNNLRCPP